MKSSDLLWRKRPFLGVLHAFSGDLAWQKRPMLGALRSVLGGPVTFKNAHDLHDVDAPASTRRV